MTFEVLNICGQGLFMKLDGFFVGCLFFLIHSAVRYCSGFGFVIFCTGTHLRKIRRNCARIF